MMSFFFGGGSYDPSEMGFWEVEFSYSFKGREGVLF